MRKILFRGKRLDNNEWVYGDLIQLHDERKYIVNNKFGACLDEKGNFINTESPFVNEVIAETIGQYTGLTDKNGKKIFEGDMLKSYYDKPGIVKWNNEIGAFQVKGIPSQTMKRCYQMEVIGNIFDKEVE